MRRRNAGLRSKSIPTLLAALSIAAGPVPVRSQGVTLEPSRLVSDPGQVVLPYSQEYVLRSRINGRTYRILVSLPPRYRDSPSDTTRYSVLYLLDGDLEFPLISLMFRGLYTGTDGSGATVDADPTQLIIVGIGYPPGHDPDRPPPGGGEVPYRMRDYSPPPFPASNPEHKNWQSEQPWAGGAPLFLRMLKEELIPAIDQRFRTTTDRGIHGHSMGGLFVAFALFADPDLFSRYAITSPSIWWDDGSILLREADLAKRSSSLSKRVFIGVGGAEGAGEISSVWRLVSALCQDRAAGHFAGLRLTAEVFPDEYHASPVPFSRALKALYPQYRADSAMVRDPCAGR